jgi:hypothetical protein
MLNQIALLILGMHRSGTSVWAGVLSKVGLQLPKRLLGPNEFNKKGYFEPEAIIRAHDRFFAELGRNWSSVHPLKDEELGNRRSDALVQELCDIVRDDFEAGNPWVIKDPRICILMPVWKRVLREIEAEPRIVMPVRAPSQVARSLSSRDSISVDHGYFLWLRHVLDAERHSRGLDRAFIDTDALTTDWRATLGSLDGTLRLGLTERIEPAGTEVDSFIDLDMIHRGKPYEPAGGAPNIRIWEEYVHAKILVIGTKQT